jgi:hypothetical protein
MLVVIVLAPRVKIGDKNYVLPSETVKTAYIIIRVAQIFV